MIVLGVESATELAGVAVGDADGVRAAAWTAGRRHGETLAPAVGHVLASAELSLAEVDVVAVDVGPGLFTGLRVGVATAKGLAQGLGVGVLGLSSLEVLAGAAFEAGWVGQVAAVVDARRGEVFAARYGPAPSGEPAGAGRPEVLVPPARYAPEALAAELAVPAATPLLAVGDGARRYAALLPVRVAGAALAAPPPGVLVAMATARLAAGDEPVGPAAVEPVYLREADARINWVQRRPVAER